MIELTAVDPKILTTEPFVAVGHGVYRNTDTWELVIYDGDQATRLFVKGEKSFATDEQKDLHIRLRALEYGVDVHSVGEHLWSFDGDPNIYSDTEAREYFEF